MFSWRYSITSQGCCSICARPSSLGGWTRSVPEYFQPSQSSRGSPAGQRVSVGEEPTWPELLVSQQLGRLPPCPPPSLPPVGEAQQVSLYSHISSQRHLKQSDSLLRKAGGEKSASSAGSFLSKPKASLSSLHQSQLTNLLGMHLCEIQWSDMSASSTCLLSQNSDFFFFLVIWTQNQQIRSEIVDKCALQISSLYLFIKLYNIW